MFPRGKNNTEKVNISSNISIDITNQIRTKYKREGLEGY